MRKSELTYLFLGIFVLAFVFFGNGIGGQFVYDDVWVINSNPTVPQVSQVFKQFILPYHYLQPDTGLYRPLTLISYTFNFLFGNSAVGFHIVNILLYAANAFLVFLLIFKLFGSRRLAYVSTALFFFLPIHVEAVTFISGRSDLLAFFFALVALLLMLNRRYWLGSAAFLLSLLSKESAVIFVPLVFAFWLWAGKKERITAIIKKEAYLFIPPAAIYGLLRFAALKRHFLSANTAYVFNPLAFADMFSRFYTALKIMMLYLWKTFVPLHFSADYSFNQIPLMHSPWNVYSVGGLAVLFAAVLVIFWKKTRTTALAWWAAIFLSSYFVVSNFVFPIGTIMAERIFYLPSLGVALIGGFAFDKLMAWKFKKLWWGILILICVFYGVVIIRGNSVWANEQSLYENMVKESPDSAHGKALLGGLYVKNEKWADGKKLLEEAYNIYPEELMTLNRLGIVAEHENRYKDAEQFYLKVLEKSPHYAAAVSNLGRLYFQTGQYQKSADLFKQQLEFRPDPEAALVYAMSESKLGRYDEAISGIKKYYGDNPADIKLKFALGYAYYKKGDKATADKYFKESKNPSISDEEFIKQLENF